MRVKTCALVGVFLTLTAGGGCIAVTAKNNRFASDRELVALNGRVYLVDKYTGAVQEMDMSHVSAFQPCENTTDDATIKAD